MKYYSLNNNSPEVDFREAVIAGLAPDRGLYFPKLIPKFEASFIETIHELSQHEIAYRAIRPFIGSSIDQASLRTIVEETLSFEFPLIELDREISVLELFHGPTLAFKDVGARFMARCLGHFTANSDQEVTVLVATSGDTGGAVASGFLGVEGIKVVILYPSGKVSDIQERQLTTLGQNITALEVDGVFDDCQAMVKRAFLDDDLNKSLQLTSANSINVARWLPQMFYYLIAYSKLNKKHTEISFSVPSGNFGNICAGLLAYKMGMPVDRFVASTNSNKAFTNYIKNGNYEALETIATISNAMDVGDPSNFSRVKAIFNDDYNKIRNKINAYSFNDIQTQKALVELYEKYSYIADPHGAVGYLGAKAHISDNPNGHCVFLETAHPSKFIDVVENNLDIEVSLPEQIKDLINREKTSLKIENYSDLKNYLKSTI